VRIGSRYKEKLQRTAQTKLNLTARTKTSRHEQKLHGTKKYCHGTNKNFTAQTKTSRHKQKLHGTNKNSTAQTKYSTVILRTRVEYEQIANEARSAESAIAHIRRE
jgi:hypothetical protein